jgi:hypothetical protein
MHKSKEEGTLSDETPLGAWKAAGPSRLIAANLQKYILLSWSICSFLCLSACMIAYRCGMCIPQCHLWMVQFVHDGHGSMKRSDLTDEPAP